jgi:hypothetical protein
MINAGADVGEIANALGRKKEAVRAWLHHHCKVWQEPEPVIHQRIVVAHEEVPSWYEAGWRIAGFDADGCLLEWQSPESARIPRGHPEVVLSPKCKLEEAA